MSNLPKKKYKIEGMHCPGCAFMVEGELEDVGIMAKCSYAAQSLEVEGEQTKQSEELIKKVVQKAGYRLIS